MVEFTIWLNPVTKKNSQQILVNRKTGRPFISQSKRYKDYEQAAGYFIKGKGLKIDYPVNVKCVYYRQTRHRVDLVNLLECTLDVLTKYEVLEDDNSNIVCSHDGCAVYYDKENPRTEITITPIKEQS